MEDTCLSLIDDITQGIGDLEIRFRNSPVSQNIVLLKGYIINAGKRDIAPDMVEKRLQLVLPEGFRWMDCQITGRANNLQIRVANLTSQNIEFDFGLFKIQEHFKFDALATVPVCNDATAKEAAKPPDVKLRGVIKFDYRIVDTGGIQKLRLRDLQTGALFPPRVSDSISDQRLPGVVRLYYSVYNSFWMASILILVGIALYLVFKYTEPKYIGYEIGGPEKHTIVVRTRVNNEQIEMYNRGGFRKTLSPKEFDELPKTAVLLPPRVRDAFILPLPYIALGLLILTARIIRFARMRKYRQILHFAKP